KVSLTVQSWRAAVPSFVSFTSKMAEPSVVDWVQVLSTVKPLHVKLAVSNAVVLKLASWAAEQKQLRVAVSGSFVARVLLHVLLTSVVLVALMVRSPTGSGALMMLLFVSVRVQPKTLFPPVFFAT